MIDTFLGKCGKRGTLCFEYRIIDTRGLFEFNTVETREKETKASGS